MPRIKVLIVAFSDSIHTARWVAQLDRKKYEIHLFPSVPFREIHSQLRDMTIWQWNRKEDDNEKGLIFRNPSFTYRTIEKGLGSSLMQKIATRFKRWQLISLRRTIRLFRPDIVHSLETQKGGYLVSKTMKRNHELKWAHSTWGIDLQYFQSFPDHKVKLERLMSRINILISEGMRDINLAHDLGYKGKSLIIPSVGGSMDFDFFDSLDAGLATSLRKKIILKGYEGEERLASYSLNALRSIKDMLQGYEVIIFSCNKKLIPLVQAVQSGKEFVLKTIDNIEYGELLRLTSQSRISITNNLSDGVPNTMLEAMALGAFPIQSNTAITEGWIENGKNGLLTDPLNVKEIAKAILQALQDDELVNAAAQINRKLVRRELSREKIQTETEKIYN